MVTKKTNFYKNRFSEDFQFLQELIFVDKPRSSNILRE